MIFQYDKYKINHFRNNELIISIDKSYILLEIGLVFISNILLYYYLWDKSNFNQIDIWKLSVGFIVITSLYNLFKNITLLFDGQVYVFNNTINRISKNGYTVDQLDNICQIRIIEYYDSDSSNQFELQIQLLNNSPIIFEKTPNLEFQKTLGKAISQISGVPFTFVNELDIHIEEQLKKKETSFQSKIEMFEKKYAKKSKSELEKIIKTDSPYDDYAKQAAKNLLKELN